LDGQCKEYARRIKAEHEKYVLKQYGEYKVPFLFATNGREYIKQYEEMSGIWFLDTRQQFNTSKALAGWPSSQGMEQDLERDIAEADRKLAATGYELLEDSNGLGLRYYQVEAIKAAEKAIAEHKNTVLLTMATGTGKTRTVLGALGCPIEEEDIPKLIGFLKRQEGNGRYFSKAMQKEQIPETGEV